jgi:hypothetical protein
MPPHQPNGVRYQHRQIDGEAGHAEEAGTEAGGNRHILRLARLVLSDFVEDGQWQARIEEIDRFMQVGLIACEHIDVIDNFHRVRFDARKYPRAFDDERFDNIGNARRELFAIRFHGVVVKESVGEFVGGSVGGSVVAGAGALVGAGVSVETGIAVPVGTDVSVGTGVKVGVSAGVSLGPGVIVIDGVGVIGGVGVGVISTGDVAVGVSETIGVAVNVGMIGVAVNVTIG